MTKYLQLSFASFNVYDSDGNGELEYNPCTDFTDSSASGDCDTVTVSFKKDQAITISFYDILEATVMIMLDSPMATA